MNKILKKLLDNNIIRSENDIYHVNDGYFIMVQNEYDGDLLVMNVVYIENDRLYVANCMTQEYEVNNIKDLTISKALTL